MGQWVRVRCGKRWSSILGEDTLKSSGSRRCLNLAGKDGVGGDGLTVVLGVGFGPRTDDGAFEGNAGKETLASAIGVDGGDGSHTGCEVSAHRAGGDAEVPAELDVPFS